MHSKHFWRRRKTWRIPPVVRVRFCFAGRAKFSGVGDFLVDNTWHFEIGGAGKGFDQVKDIPTAYVVNDDTEIGIGNKIPLWLFGFLY